MKKNFLAMTALAAMLFAGCTSSDDLTTRETITKANEAATPINFGTYMGKTGTRTTNGKTGAITTTSLHTGTSATDGFGVFAYYTDTTPWANNQTSFNANFMYNQQVTTDGSTGWSYSPAKYWPNDIATAAAVDNQSPAATGSVTGGKVSFFAYAPYVENTTGDDGIVGMTSNTANEAPKITYKLPNTPNESSIVDLLWGMRGAAYYQAPDGTASGSATGYNTDLTKQTKDEKVNFLFKHALARLGGSATTGNHGGIWVALDIDDVRTSTGNSNSVAKPDATLVTVKSIKIENGELSTPYTFKRQGIFNLATGTWSSLSDDYTISDEVKYNDPSTKLNSAIAEPATLTNGGSGWNVAGVTTDLQQMYTGKDSYYLIPSTTDQTLKITVEYTVRTYDAKLSNSGNPWTTVNQTISKIVTFTGGLESNKIYRLNLYLGLTSVKFTATVSNWSPASGGDEGEELREVDLPINVANP